MSGHIYIMNIGPITKPNIIFKIVGDTVTQMLDQNRHSIDVDECPTIVDAYEEIVH